MDSREPEASGSGEAEEECLAWGEGCQEEHGGMHPNGVDLAEVLGTWPLQASSVLRGEEVHTRRGQRS